MKQIMQLTIGYVGTILKHPPSLLHFSCSLPLQSVSLSLSCLPSLCSPLKEKGMLGALPECSTLSVSFKGATQENSKVREVGARLPSMRWRGGAWPCIWCSRNCACIKWHFGLRPSLVVAHNAANTLETSSSWQNATEAQRHYPVVPILEMASTWTFGWICMSVPVSKSLGLTLPHR